MKRNESVVDLSLFNEILTGLSRRRKKIELQAIEVEAYAAEGKSIARLEDGKVLFIPNAIPGDIVDVRVLKNKKSYAEGKVLKLVKPSDKRVEAFCEHFGVCGGCKWQMLPYEQQLEYKQQQVIDQLKRIGHVDLPEIQPIKGSPVTTFYRNKLEFTFCTHRYLTYEEIEAAGDAILPQEPALGFHAPGFFDKVVPVNECHLQPEPTNTLLKVLRQYSTDNELPYYDHRAHVGFLRNIVIRVARTGEVLVNLIVQEDKQELHDMLAHIKQHVPGITSLHYTINPKVNDSIHDLDVHLYSGKGYIEETLEGFRFIISPKSFFQTNTHQAETLYDITRDFAGLTGEEVLYDLYCGTGSIGIFCSQNAKKVIGIEVVEDAIEDAKKNAALNNLDKCKYFAGDVSAICTDEFFNEHGRPDVIITDPPRAGMHEKLIQQLLKMAAPKIVYVSCNPATQARDLQLLSELYNITKLQPVDMFPHTHHIENVALLQLK